jgi:hypothetical protein
VHERSNWLFAGSRRQALAPEAVRSVGVSRALAARSSPSYSGCGPKRFLLPSGSRRELAVNGDFSA